jgi:hypothetical protein
MSEVRREWRWVVKQAPEASEGEGFEWAAYARAVDTGL